MSPWWSKPTADDFSDDKEEQTEAAEAAAASPEDDEVVKTAAATAKAEGEAEEAKSGRRRRPRRRRSERPSGEEEEKAADRREAKTETPKAEMLKADKPKTEIPKADKPKADTPAARESRRSEPAESTHRAAEGPSSDDEASEGRRRPRRAAPGGARSPEPAAAPAERDREAAARKVAKPARGNGRQAAHETERTLGFGIDLEPDEIGKISREIVVSLPERSHSVNDERKIALFCDLENVALGVRDSSEVSKFDIHLVLERLLEKGKIIVKKAYCDWERYHDYKRAFHEAAIELIDIPQKYYSGKNSADIKMVVDAMDLSYSKEHLDTFVLLSGDSDFSPLVSKLKENNKYVIAVGVKGASSNLLIDNCDEFLFYEDIWRDSQQAPKLDGLGKKTTEAFSLMIDAIQALVRENKDVLWGSMIKQTMQRKKPSFNEGYYGYGSFSELLQDAERNGIVKLKKDQRSGSYIVTSFSSQ